MNWRVLTSLRRDRRASAAAEMALVTPLLLILLMGSVELGNYFMNEHTLLKGVRDGARYAARQGFSSFSGCPSDLSSTTLGTNTKSIVRKGTLNSTDNDLLPNWASGSTQFSVTTNCSTTLGLGGIYTGNSMGTANVSANVVVTAKLPYRPLLASFGFTGVGYFLNATQQAAVTGV